MFTIKDFLEMKLVPWYRNLTDAPIPMTKPIEYASVNDLPLDDFIRENEMVISIATPYMKDEKLMTEFINGLIDANASIFLLATPSNKLVLSDKNIKIAKENDLPIFQIPWEIRFADILEAVLTEIHTTYNKEVDGLKELQTKLLEAFLSNSEISEAAKIISESLECDVTIQDLNGNIICGKDDPAEMYSISLESDNHLYGYFCFNLKKTIKIVSLLRRILSPLLMLWFYKDDIISNAQRMARDDFVWDLACGEDPKSENTIRSAELMGFHLSCPYTCIVGRPMLDGSHDKAWGNSWMTSNINSLKKDLLFIAQSMGCEIMITHQKDLIIIYLENLMSGAKESVNRFLDRAEEYLRRSSPRIFFSWGISEIKTNLTNFRTYFIHAKLAEELCAGNTGTGKRFQFEDTIIFNIMSALSTNEEIMKALYNIICPLIEYDKTSNGCLMNTLKSYLSYRNISETARNLNMHRQSLLYKLNKIEELTDLSLKNTEDIFLMEICMHLYADFSNKLE
ncbi:MAG: PucR family transcriptional regulator [Erysipelotrichaceae bacterium]|nr:PucR family transcriptional regulator [Erysipelotrichaceae bacterium]